jgi:hypothetical protein
MKIAFCFLTYDIIVRYDIWNKFFNHVDSNKYTVFIHPKNIINNNPYTFQYNIIKNRIMTTTKDNINIVKATLKLLEETYISDNDITHFIFLSQSCIPLYSFNKIYEVIIKFPHSVISHINHNKKERYFQLSNIIKKFINYNNFIKQQPNMILIKNDVELLIKNDLTEHFRYMTCPDEHYFVNILPHILKRVLIRKQISFCNNDLKKTQALEFKNVNKNFINIIRNQGFLFMRKVKNDTYIDSKTLFSI